MFLQGNCEFFLPNKGHFRHSRTVNIRTEFRGVLTGGGKKPINRKHINIFLTALAGQSSQGRTPTHPRDKRTKWRFYCGSKQETAALSQGRVPICPREGSRLSQGQFLFVPDTVRPQMFMFIGFFLARLTQNRTFLLLVVTPLLRLLVLNV